MHPSLLPGRTLPDRAALPVLAGQLSCPGDLSWLSSLSWWEELSCLGLR